MNRKRWAVVAIAIVLFVAATLSSIGLQSEPREESIGTQWGRLFERGTIQEEVLEPGVATERILVIPVEGTISGSETGYSQELTLAALEQIENDPTVQAVLLAIDSPGGAVYEIREVYDRIMEVRQETSIPIYASMGSTAASGGYYIAMGADKIYASPETLTGSIGVILSSYNLEGLYQNLGIEPVVFKSGEMKDLFSTSRAKTEEEQEILQTYIDESFQAFVEAVMAGRNMSEEEVRTLADGRIYSGRQALENALIDELGYGKDALQELREAYQLEDAQVFQLKRAAVPLDSFLSPFFGENGSSPTGLVDGLVEEMEEIQGLHLEYRWQGGQ